ncbi:MAG: M28 family peptidase [Thermoanaerobaculia bacterium]
MKKFFFLFNFLFFSSFIFSYELFFIEKEGKNTRNGYLSQGLNIIAETEKGFLFLNEGFERLDGLEIKKIGDFSRDLYFITERFEGADINSCGRVLFKEGNLYLVEAEEKFPCLGTKNFFVHKLSMEKLSPSKSFKKISLEKNFFVEDMLNNFNSDLAQEELLELVGFADSRYSTNPGCFSSTQRAYEIFQNLGLDVEFQDYSLTFAPNVVGTLEGLLEKDKIIILIAHIDDMPKTPPAPGANDNGSGSSMVLNLARVLSNYRFAYTIKFILVTGEEQGLVGSSYYATKAYQKGEDILAVLNADMIGWEGDGKPQEEDLDLSYDENSQGLAEMFAETYNLYENLVPVNMIYCPTNYYSDHYSFWERGYPAIMGITDNEGICFQKGTYPYYHTHLDTVENCGDLDFYIKSLRSYLAVLAHMAKPLCKVMDSKKFTNLDFKYICPVRID